MIGHGTAIPLGRGATSQVYRVFDAARGAWLAVKYLNHGDPVWRARLLREARALRQLDHPHICPIYDVGELDGRPWLAMPLLSGKTLDAAAAELPLEARVRVLMQVAQAVHHAHEHGLLHRDLKPANIIVDVESGLPHAWVLDFGLVRDAAAPGGTQTGEVLGTPAYMSPEQARGAGDLDRRSDVFSLGAILYFLLTGAPPSAGASSAEVLANVIREEPLPPRRLRRDVPPALQAIALQCLEKRRERRYDSARALAEDLERYLIGEPVLARRDARTRLRRFVRRHPAAVAIGATAFAAALAIGATWIVQARGNAERVHAAAAFAAQAEAARQMLALAYSRPEHDIRPTLSAAQEVADRLGADAQAQPPHLRAHGWFAAGQVLLAMGDIERARAALLTARRDDDFPDLARLLGLAHARAYRQRLAEPQMIGDPELRQAALDAARRELLAPAQALLRASEAQSEPDRLAQAELAYAEGRTDEALSILAAGAESEPWRYELRLVTAEILHERGQAAHWSGRRDDALTALDAAEHAVADALAYGRSDPLLHRRRCEATALRYEAAAEGGYPRDDAAAAMSACEAALRVQPESAPVHAALAHLLSFRARAGRATGKDPMPLLEQALRAAQTALDLAPDDARAAQTFARVQTRMSNTRRWAGEADLALIEPAEQALAPWIDRGDPDAELLYVAAMAASEKALMKEALGQDAEAEFRRSARLLEAAVRRAPAVVFVRQNLASVLSSLQYYLANRGRPEAALSRQAIAELEIVLSKRPGRAMAWGALADAHWDLVIILANRGEPFDHEAAQAHAHYGKAVELDGENMNIAFNWYSFSLLAAAEYLRIGQPAQADIDRAAALMARMDAKRPAWITPCPRAEYHLRRGAWLIGDGRSDDGRAALHEAERLLDEALRDQPDDVDCARRKLEVVAARIAALPPASLADEIDAARVLRDRHAAVPQIQLAWLELLAAALPRLSAVRRADAAAEIPNELAQLREQTGEAWRARLAPLEAISL